MNSTIVLSICSVVSERLSSSALSVMVGGDAEYCRCTRKSVDESSEENCEMKVSFDFLVLKGLEKIVV